MQDPAIGAVTAVAERFLPGSGGGGGGGGGGGKTARMMALTRVEAHLTWSPEYLGQVPG